jgi:dipeptidyl aminopeptidase/acylaminoacyl peptidase
MKKIFLLLLCFDLFFGCSQNQKREVEKEEVISEKKIVEHPLSIEYLRSKKFPGSRIEIVDTVLVNDFYSKYIVSYKSGSLNIHAALAVPQSEDPESTFPIIILNHGYIPPDKYDNTRKYVRYIDFMVRNGFIVCMTDYRGHGESQGIPEPPYFRNDYLTDVMNALNSVAKLEYVDTTNIFMWGHSMGGTLTQQAMVIDNRIKAGVIWGGVVGTYKDMFYTYQEKTPWVRKGGYIVQKMNEMENRYGEFSLDNEFWKMISPIAHLHEISGPVQLHHARYDPSVPVELSIAFAQHMENAEQSVELFIYNSSDHNIGNPHFEEAMQRTVDFYKEYVE